MSKVTFTTGNFSLVIQGELSPDQREKADAAAIRWITQRDVASEVYKQMAGVKNSKGNLQLPEGFERDSIAYSDDNAELLKNETVKALGKYGSFTVEVSQHIAGESAAPRAMATQMWEKVKSNPALLTSLGLDASATDEVGIEACHTFLSGLRKQKAK